jgi:hypothetical protein
VMESCDVWRTTHEANGTATAHAHASSVKSAGCNEQPLKACGPCRSMAESVPCTCIRRAQC